MHLARYGVDDHVGVSGTLGLSVDTGADSLAVDTPRAVVDGWNTDRDVLMVELDVSSLCLAATDKQGNALDFRACLNQKNGMPVDTSSMATECTLTSHCDQSAKNPKLRLRCTDPLGVFAIMAPRSNLTVAPRCFSRPLFELSQFPPSLISLSRHLVLLEIKAEPSVFKFLLEGYPGVDAIWDMIKTRPTTPL